jgi:HEPN domain-containing protein
MPITKAELQKLADERLAEAEALFAAGRHSGAYYLAGYAAELALKAIIASTFKADQIPDKKRVDAIFTHELDKLANQAGLRGALEARSQASRAFEGNWTIASGWSEAARYQVWTQADAFAFLRALADPEEGVMPWLKTFW